MENFIVADDCMMVSFDVKSLFTSIPIDLALQAVTEAVNQH